MKKLLFKFLIVFVFSTIVFAAPRRGQDLIPSGHWVYDALWQVELDCGRWNFIDQTPLSIQTIKGILDEVPYERLSESGKIQYQRILDYFEEHDISLNAGIFSFGIEPKVNVEFYAKTNDDLGWVYNNHERQRTIEVPWRIALGDYLTVLMGFAVGQRRRYLENENQNYVNHFFTEEAFDPNLTHSTYLSTGYRWNNGIGLNFSFGYGKQTFGRASLGSAILSDYLTDIPYLQLRVYSPVFVYSFNVQQLNPKTTLYTHTIDFRLFKKLNIGMMEGGAGYNDFDMTFINPFGIFHAYEMHNHYDWISLFALKVNYVPVKNLRLYFLYAMNEHQMASESSSGSGASPEGNTMQGGVDFQLPLQGGFLKFNLEGYYAAPYYGIKESPNWSFVSAKDGTYEWMGSPVGPDSIAGKFSAEYEKPGHWSLGLNYIFAARGEFAKKSIFGLWSKGSYDVDDDSYRENVWIYPTATNKYKDGRDFKSPHGVAEYDNIIYLRGTYSPTKWFTLVAQPSYIMAFNAGHIEGNFEHGFEMALSCRFDFCRIPKKPINLDFLLKDKIDREQELRDE